MPVGASGRAAYRRGARTTGPLMSTISRSLLLLLLVLVLGGVIFLVTYDVPPPTREIEIIIPDEQLPE